MLAPGSRFAGFTLIAPLGRGAQGEVHRARSPQGHEVALKILRHELADAEAAGRFRREMTLLPSLHHPNVLRCIATGEAEGRLWIATDLAQGTLRLGIQIADGTKGTRHFDKSRSAVTRPHATEEGQLASDKSGLFSWEGDA